jgi:uncharacterized protein YecA (UPF0149 family)|tara:strand:+ start:489 stop:806 length:318 start_codon:yes stop_codon:yes gene_type:complete
MKKKKNKRNRKEGIEKVMEHLIDSGRWDELIESGCIKTFYGTPKELEDYLKSEKIDKSEVLNVGGEEGRRIVEKIEKIGRNQKCPCGSGIKYKKCCLINNQVGVS